MDLLKDNVGKIFRRYLLTSIGSAVITSIYSTVDMVVSGQYEGPAGSAALSVIMPMWSVILSLGLLLGLGGAILMSNARGSGNHAEGAQYFTLSLIAGAVVTALLTAAFCLFRTEFLRLCGANDAVLPYAMAYTKWLTVAVPFFLLGEVAIIFVRNDNAPGLATAAILGGGILNIFGDIFFVFTCDMGIEGAGLATAIGQVFGVCILCTHFFRKRCTLRLAKIRAWRAKLGEILSTGFAAFVVDISFGVLVALFNNQIMRYAGDTALAVFGTVANVAILIQALFYGVGQAMQPIVSLNMGAGNTARIRQTLRLALWTAACMGALFCAVVMAFPREILCIYMDASDAVLAIGPQILRLYAPAFLLMGLNIAAGYYLQAVLQTKRSLAISLLRGFILCAALIYLLPPLFGFDAIWLTMPLTELITVFFAAAMLRTQ